MQHCIHPNVPAWRQAWSGLPAAPSPSHPFRSQHCSRFFLASPRLRTNATYDNSSFSAALERATSEQAVSAPTDEQLWQGLHPHFGTRALQDLLQQAVALLSSTMPPLPGMPDLSGISSAEQQVYDASLGQVASAASAWKQSVAGQAMDLSAVVAREAAVLLGDAGPLEPHFGTRAALRLVDELQHWVQGLGFLQGPTGGQPTFPALPSFNLEGLPSLENLSQALQGLSAASSSPAASEWLQTLQQRLADSTAATTSFGEAFSNRSTLNSLATSLNQALASSQAEGIGGYSLATVALITAGVTALIAASVPPDGYSNMNGIVVEDSLPRRYDIAALEAYYARRPVLVAQRIASLASAAAGLGSGLLLDIALGNQQAHAAVRAVQLRQTLERLGPAYVKVAQAVSTRVDLLDPVYLEQIVLLQDRVPPFPTSQARPLMATAFGQPVEAVLERISSEPVAAASLGQVYRGRLRGGSEVAIKVQRPDVLDSVALDLFLMRRMALFLRGVPQVKTDWVGLIDEWATRFFMELDYDLEVQNALLFKQQMASLEGIVVPDIYADLSDREVLTTAWVDGEKLSESYAGDVRELCTTLLNCYLIQLLESGFLHADPHPGNLIRTPDGKICILDYGLMTEVTPEQSIALVEYIAHLSVQDWDSVPEDLLRLGFIPEGAPNPRESGLAGPLGRVLTQLSQGGGAKGINIDVVTAELEALTAVYPFQIPSYFALILRAFSVIEGIALRVDPTYSIVQECFPYLSRRLLLDDAPRIQAALKGVLYNGRNRLDVGRLRRLTTGLSRFTVSGLSSQEEETVQAAPLLNSTGIDLLRAVFSRRGSYVQTLLIEELVVAVDALSREALSQLFGRVLGSLPALAAMNTVELLGPLRPLLLPLPTPVEVISRLAPAVAPTEEDEEALSTIRSILELAQGPALRASGSATPSTAQLSALYQELSPLLPELLPGVAYTGELFVRQLIRRIAMRVADDMQAPPSTRPDGSGGPSNLTSVILDLLLRRPQSAWTTL